MATVTVNDYLVVLSGVKDFKKATEYVERVVAEGKVETYDEIAKLRAILSQIYHAHGGDLDDADKINIILNQQWSIFEKRDHYANKNKWNNSLQQLSGE